MHLIPVTDLNLPELRIYKELRDKSLTADNSFIADSPKVVNILLETPLKIRSILATREYYDAHAELISQKEVPDLYVAEKKVMEGIVGHTVHHNVMMHGTRPTDTDLEALGDHLLMLDSLTSTENIGSISRSAACMGVDALVLPRQGPHPYSRRALRVSMGYVSRLDIHRYDDIFETLAALKGRGYRIFGAEAAADATLLSQVEVPGRWVLLMGHEGKGLSPEVLEGCDETVMIEMAPGVKSFNVGVAASILIYQFKNRIIRPLKLKAGE